MKRIILMILTVVLISGLSAEFTLWEKARAIAEANWRLVPGKTEMSMNLTRVRSGELIFGFDLAVRHSLGAEGEIINELEEIDMQGEGYDDNDKRLQELLDRDMRPKKKGIFFSDDPENPQLKLIEESKVVNGIRCTGYEFEYTATDDDKEIILTGIVWLNSETGAAVSSQASMKNTPLLVRSIDIEQFYHIDNDTGYWHLSKIKTDIDIRVPFRNMINKMTQKYTDHWIYDNRLTTE